MTVKTLGTDVARKLQSLSTVVEGKLPSPAQTIIEAVLKVTDDADAVVAAAKGVDFTDFKQASAFYRHFVQPLKREWVDLLRYNSMLSSPKTHIINAASNLINSTLIATVEKLAVGQIDFLRAAITGTPRQRLTGEAGVYLKAYFGQLKEASHRFGDVMAGRSASTNLDTRHSRRVCHKHGAREPTKGEHPSKQNPAIWRDFVFACLTVVIRPPLL